MELQIQTKTIGFSVIDTVFRYFNVPMDKLYSNRGDKAKTQARMYVYYILHYEYNISINQISLLMKKNERNIYKRIASLRTQLTYYEEVKKEYKELLSKIKG